MSKLQLASTLRVIQARECSRVERAHTLPHHGSYTNGQHSHDAITLYLILCPEPKMEVIKAIHLHDYGERWCGDIPAPTKWAAPDVGKRLHALESRCLTAMGLGFTISNEDVAWLKGVDSLELWLWAHDQMAMGNSNAVSVVGNLNAFFTKAELPDEIVSFIKDYQWTRTPDTLPK